MIDRLQARYRPWLSVTNLLQKQTVILTHPCEASSNWIYLIERDGSLRWRTAHPLRTKKKSCVPVGIRNAEWIVAAKVLAGKLTHRCRAVFKNNMNSAFYCF
ncbi:hypothetical protein ACVS90_003742 [Cronobacter dublinensis]